MKPPRRCFGQDIRRPGHSALTAPGAECRAGRMGRSPQRKLFMIMTQSTRDHTVATPEHGAAALIASPTRPAGRATDSMEIQTIKARQKAMWESGDFGQIARSIENVAEEFMARQPLRAGARVLDVASGTGNLAVVAARRGCAVSGIDIAANLAAQARPRAAP